MTSVGNKTTLVVSARNVEKYFGRQLILDDVSIEVRAGEVVCVIGPSGSGKTTFLRCVNHLERIDSGIIEINGRPLGYREDSDGRLRELSDKQIAQHRAEIGFVFQRFNLWPHMTVLDNVTAGPVIVKHVPRRVAAVAGRQLLDRVGLLDKADMYPRQLSGGQQQRVAIARALANEPILIAFDEPTSALDPETTSEVLDVMIELAKGGTTMLCVTHEIEFARRVADRIVVMDKGRVIESGDAGQVLERPSHERTSLFLNRILRGGG